ncbi:MAG: class II aldolase/adducin family protein [Alphaproteobacteria bacterium]
MDATGDDISLILDELVMGHRILSMEGHDELTLGHLSWRSPDGRGFWMKRHSIAMCEVMGQEDLVLVDFDGKKLEGGGNRHSEWPIHAGIYLARDDVNSVAHTHAFHATVFGAVTNSKLRAIAHAGAYFAENVPRFTETAQLVRSADKGKQVAEALGDAWALLMRNHGITFCGRNIRHCVILGYFLERACRQQLALDGSGLEWEGHTDEEVATKGADLLVDQAIEMFWNHLNRKLGKFEAANGVTFA